MDSDDEVDLRPYVRTLAHHWGLARDLILLAVLVSGLYLWLAPRTYEATARLAVVRAGTSQVDARTWRFTLAGLVASPRIADGVSRELADRLPPEMTGDRLASHVEGRARPDAQLVEITARMPTPSLAADVANSWAWRFESSANALFEESGVEVAFVVPAVPPTAPAGASRWPFVLAAAAGLALAVAWGIAAALGPDRPTPSLLPRRRSRTPPRLQGGASETLTGPVAL